MIELIQRELEGQLDLRADTPARRYQEAFHRLLGRCGQDGVNRIIRRAVLRARQPPPAGAELEAAEAGKPEVCDALERDVGGWSLNPAVESLGTILAEYPEQFGKVLLTSNFDPLIEVSLRRAGAGGFRTITLYTDASLGWSRGDGCNVVHFHGYWSDSDTFHMQGQLEHSRPQLASSLATLLRERTVVVAAYGGWDDVFTRALTGVSQEAESFPEVLWLFRESDPEEIRKRFLSRIESLEPAVIRGRLLLYGGIDVISFFPRLLESLRKSVPRRASLPELPAEPSDLPPGGGLPAQLTIEGLPAFSNGESTLRALPLDLGTAWGLERGAFSVVLAGCAEDRGYRALLRSEEALWKASRAREDLPSLPIRWWVRIGPDLPPVPETAAEVWAAPRDSGSARLAYLRSHGLPKDLLPGFFLVAPAAGKGLSPELLLWWKALLRIFSALPVAIAVHLDLQEEEALAGGIKEIERRVGASAARLFAARADSSDPGDAALEDLASLEDPSGRPPAFEDRVLALMRRSQGATGAARWESILAQLSEQLSPELRAVDRLRQGASQEAVDDFFRTRGPGEHRLALRAGLDLWPSRTVLQSLDIDEVDRWRLLTALPVDAERAGDLLAIEDPACRAVFGLCTPREWQGVQRDKTLERLVLDARRQRPLTFPNGSDS